MSPQPALALVPPFGCSTRHHWSLTKIPFYETGLGISFRPHASLQHWPPLPHHRPSLGEPRRDENKENKLLLPILGHFTVHITTHDIANVSTAASITMSDHWSWNTFIGHRVGKLLFPFAKSHKLNVYLRPAWRWSVHCASWQSFSQRSDLGPAPPALRSPGCDNDWGKSSAALCVVKWRIELSTQFHDIWRAYAKQIFKRGESPGYWLITKGA